MALIVNGTKYNTPYLNSVKTNAYMPEYGGKSKVWATGFSNYRLFTIADYRGSDNGIWLIDFNNQTAQLSPGEINTEWYTFHTRSKTGELLLVGYYGVAVWREATQKWDWSYMYTDGSQSRFYTTFSEDTAGNVYLGSTKSSLPILKLPVGQSIATAGPTNMAGSWVTIGVTTRLVYVSSSAVAAQRLKTNMAVGVDNAFYICGIVKEPSLNKYIIRIDPSGTISGGLDLPSAYDDPHIVFNPSIYDEDGNGPYTAFQSQISGGVYFSFCDSSGNLVISLKQARSTSGGTVFLADPIAQPISGFRKGSAGIGYYYGQGGIYTVVFHNLLDTNDNTPIEVQSKISSSSAYYFSNIGVMSNGGLITAGPDMYYLAPGASSWQQDFTRQADDLINLPDGRLMLLGYTAPWIETNGVWSRPSWLRITRPGLGYNLNISQIGVAYY